MRYNSFFNSWSANFGGENVFFILQMTKVNQNKDNDLLYVDNPSLHQ